jgi:hypothetical protein
VVNVEYTATTTFCCAKAGTAAVSANAPASATKDARGRNIGNGCGWFMLLGSFTFLYVDRRRPTGVSVSTSCCVTRIGCAAGATPNRGPAGTRFKSGSTGHPG